MRLGECGSWPIPCARSYAGRLHALLADWLGRMAADQNRTGAVLDHAFAVRSWAARSPSKRVGALHEMLFSRAYAAEGNTAASARAHERAIASAGTSNDNHPYYLSWVTPSVVETVSGALQVRLPQPGLVIAAAERLLAGLDPKFKRRHGLLLARYSSALTMAKEIPEAAARLTEAADITRQHSSARLSQEIGQARARLEPWAATSYVQQLDEVLRSRGLTSERSAVEA